MISILLLLIVLAVTILGTAVSREITVQETKQQQVEERMRAGESGRVEDEYAGTKRDTAYLPPDVDDGYIGSVLHESQIDEDAIGVMGIFYAIISLTMLAVMLTIACCDERIWKKLVKEQGIAASMAAALESPTPAANPERTVSWTA